jgi:hypothetical protein
MRFVFVFEYHTFQSVGYICFIISKWYLPVRLLTSEAEEAAMKFILVTGNLSDMLSVKLVVTGYFVLVCRLVKTFAELRSMADEGQIQYPYSTREVVNIVKHLEVSSSRLSSI